MTPGRPKAEKVVFCLKKTRIFEKRQERPGAIFYEFRVRILSHLELFFVLSFGVFWRCDFHGFLGSILELFWDAFSHVFGVVFRNVFWNAFLEPKRATSNPMRVILGAPGRGKGKGKPFLESKSYKS